MQDKLKLNRKQIAALLIIAVISAYYFLQKSSQTAHLADIGQSGAPEEDRGDSQDFFDIPFYDEIQKFLGNLFDQIFGDSQDGNGSDQSEDEVKLPFSTNLSIEFLLLVLFLIMVIGVLAVSYHYFVGARSEVPRLSEEEALQRRIERLGIRVEKIIENIDHYLNEGKFTEGIIEGYKELDKALWDFSRLQRRKHDTPLEHSRSRSIELLMVDRLYLLVDQFYNRRYRMASATQTDLLEFKRNLRELVPQQVQKMKPDWKEREEEARGGR
ncbi:MAG: hypothetical protein ACXAEI_01315 [Candidatus Hodarchaeales archaeon]|jgi:hypothetical protein